jgi:tRNA dimethylallyltransferase
MIARVSNPGRKVILIAGPTASGKSALALTLAERLGGVVINADSMQVYREMRVLTARPSPEEEGRAPHRLYGHVPAAEAYSVARWLVDATREIEQARAADRVPIVTGGTGLYFKALLEGLSPVPAIPEAVRNRWRERGANALRGELHRELIARDPQAAARLAPTDIQRIVRALEVLEATGKSLIEWQLTPGNPVLSEAETVRIIVGRDRALLHERCDRRFEQMVREGALDEARTMGALGLDCGLPAMRAIGLRPLIAHLGGEIDLATAVQRGQAETRQYVKRQDTWARRYFSSWKFVQTKQLECASEEIVPLIQL